MRRDAFTLIELVVVIAVMAVLATLAVLSLGGTLDRYQLSRAAETVEIFDARARRDARRLRTPIEGTIDRQRNLLEVEGPSQRLYRLPRSVEVNTVRIGRRVTVGNEFAIAYGRSGSSPTYAVELTRGGMSRWLVVLGFSGQVIPVDNEEQVDEILSL